MWDSVTGSLATYPYLFAGLLGLGLTAGLYAFAGRQRRMMILSGLLCLPLVPAAMLFEGNYWSPVRLGGWALGAEDFLFAFSTSSTAWLIAAWPFRRRAILDSAGSIHLRRVAIVYAVGWAVFLILWRAGLAVMTAHILATAAVLLFVLILRRRLWPMALRGAVGGVILYAVVLRTFFWIWPGFVSQWARGGVWGMIVVGLPLGEIVWACVFSAAWPLSAAYAFDVAMRADAVPARGPAPP